MDATCQVYRMPDRPGVHSTEVRGSDVLVQWYDFGEHAPYESLNTLIFGRRAQKLLMDALSCPSGPPNQVAQQVATLCASYFDVRALADRVGIPYTHEVSFDP